jgi:hypothetical protein
MACTSPQHGTAQHATAFGMTTAKVWYLSATYQSPSPSAPYVHLHPATKFTHVLPHTGGGARRPAHRAASPFPPPPSRPLQGLTFRIPPRVRSPPPQTGGGGYGIPALPCIATGVKLPAPPAAPSLPPALTRMLVGIHTQSPPPIHLHCHILQQGRGCKHSQQLPSCRQLGPPYMFVGSHTQRPPPTHTHTYLHCNILQQGRSRQHPQQLPSR